VDLGRGVSFETEETTKKVDQAIQNGKIHRKQGKSSDWRGKAQKLQEKAKRISRGNAS
jgi:hypothetical protein